MKKNQCNTCQYNYNCTIQEESKFAYDETPCNEYLAPINNSKGMFNRWFTYKGRIRRMELFLTYILLCILYYIVVLLHSVNPNPNYTLVQLLVVVFFVIRILQEIKRCHDVGKSGWWILVPIFNPFFLLFENGQEGINEYGTNPKESYESQVNDQ